MDSRAVANRERLFAALAGRYTLERELGHGGMATVYLARDVRNDRRVALKALHPELNSALGARFQREIRVAGRLQHPHILPVLDSGDAAGRHWFTMPFVDGENLRDRLARESRLPIADAVRIAGQVADALAFAHAQQIIHRDIKPENILLAGDQALVADFGIARAVGEEGGKRITGTGLSVGTAAYMSPEQAAAEQEIDGRSDVYSLGCVLFEMLVGQPPFTGPTAQAVIARRFSGEVPAARHTRPDLPDALDAILRRSLARAPGDRFADAAALRRALGAVGRPDGAPRPAGAAMRVFVAGATGVIGRRVVSRLVARGHVVTAIGRTGEKRAALARAGARAVDTGLFDADALARMVRGHDAVVNLATHIPASSARMLLRRSWRENDCLRRDGSAALAAAAVREGVPRLIQESFAPIYADGGDAWLDESSPVAPAPYNRTSLDAERSAAEVTAAGGAGVVLRFGYFLGADSALVADLIRLVRRGWFALPGRGDAFISSVTHDDAAAAVVAALDAPAGIYNVVDDEPLTRRDFANALADALAVPYPRLLPAWVGRIGGATVGLLSRSQRISNRKLRDATGWAPDTPSMRAGWKSIVAGS